MPGSPADGSDRLAGFRDRFLLPSGIDGNPVVYLAGHSLGLQPRSAPAAIQAAVGEWGTRGVRGWFDPDVRWVDLDRKAAGLVAPIVGALHSETAVAGTLTANLHAMLTSFYRPEGRRRRVLMEARPFPSDRYAVQSHARWHGLDPAEVVLEAGPGSDSGEKTGDAAVSGTDRLVELIGAEGDDIALVLVGAVNYWSGEWFDLARVTNAARSRGCAVGFDLAHAAGNVPLHLHDDGPDFAVWCGYKYLNGGPGAPAGYFVHERHHAAFEGNRLAGWWGHDPSSRFQMPDAFRPAAGAAGWQISTPPVLGLAPLTEALGILDEAGMPALRERSVSLTGHMEHLIRERLTDEVDVLTPTDPSRRGAQLSLRVRSGARSVFERLGETDVVCDWRQPDAIRVSPAPLYTSFGDVEAFVDRLEDAVARVRKNAGD